MKKAVTRNHFDGFVRYLGFRNEKVEDDGEDSDWVRNGHSKRESVQPPASSLEVNDELALGLGKGATSLCDVAV